MACNNDYVLYGSLKSSFNIQAGFKIPIIALPFVCQKRHLCRLEALQLESYDSSAKGHYIWILKHQCLEAESRKMYGLFTYLDNCFHYVGESYLDCY